MNFALSPTWKNPGDAATALGVTATISLLNPLLGAIFLALLVAGSSNFTGRQEAPKPNEPPAPPEAAPVSDATKKRITAALKAAP